MNQNETYLVQKSSEKFHCNLCSYSSSRKGQYLRHLETYKHKINQNEINEINLSPKVANSFQCSCGICFNSRTTLWRHKKKCTFKLKNDNLITDKELIIMLVKQNTELMDMLKNNNSSQVNSLNNNNTQSCV
jgi:hypothetical protein